LADEFEEDRHPNGVWDVYSFPCICTYSKGYHALSLIQHYPWKNKEPDQTVTGIDKNCFIHPTSVWFKAKKIKQVLAAKRATQHAGIKAEDINKSFPF